MDNAASYQKKVWALTTMLTCFFINIILFFVIGTTPTESMLPMVSKLLYGLMSLNILIAFGAVVIFQLNRKATA